MYTACITSTDIIWCKYDCAIGSKVGMKFSVTGIIGINEEACDRQTCVYDMVVIIV